MGNDFSHLTDRVGPPETSKDVDVKLHDAVYNFGRAKYLGLDAHLGAICVVNGWLDKVKVHVDEHTGKRTFRLPFIHEGDKIKLPEAGQLQELDKKAFEYWNQKYPAKAKSEAPKTPDAPGTPGAPKSPDAPKTPDGNPEKGKTPQGPADKPESPEAKRDRDISLAKKVARDLQTDLMQRNAELDKGIGSIFGHGADAIGNAIGHGSNNVRKALDEKQNQIKALDKQAGEGKFADFANIYKSLTGTDFSADTKQPHRVAIDKEFKEFNKDHTTGVEWLTEAATFGVNWLVSSRLGKAKGAVDFFKQAGLMALSGGAAKTAAKGIEHGNLNSGAEDFRSGAVTGLAFFVGDKTTRGLHSAFKAQTWQKYLTRGAVSGGAGGALYGAIDGPNMGYASARNEGRTYDAVKDGLHDAGLGAGFGLASGALLGTAFGGWEHLTRKPKLLGAPPKEGPRPIGSGPHEGAKTGSGPVDPVGEGPKPQGETPKPQADAPEPEVQTPKPQVEAYDIELKPWQNFDVVDNATWAQLKKAFVAFRRHCTPDAIQARLDVMPGTPEYVAWQNSKSYDAVVEFNKKVNSAWKSIEGYGMPTPKGRNVAAHPEAINCWRGLEASYGDLQKALESFKAGI